MALKGIVHGIEKALKVGAKTAVSTAVGSAVGSIIPGGAIITTAGGAVLSSRGSRKSQYTYTNFNPATDVGPQPQSDYGRGQVGVPYPGEVPVAVGTSDVASQMAKSQGVKAALGGGGGFEPCSRRRRRRDLLTKSDRENIAFLIGVLGKGSMGQSAINTLLANRS